MDTSADDDILILKHHHDRFTIISRRITEGQTGLSLRATGLLCHLLGKPDSWKTWSRHLAKHWRCSRTVVLAILNELREAGYARLDVRRDEQGRLGGKFWRISDLPEFGAQAPKEAKTALKAHAGTDGLLSRESEKSEHRKSSPLLSPDSLTESRKKKENGASPEPPLLLLLDTGAGAPGPATGGAHAPPAPSPLFTAFATAYQDALGRPYRPDGKDEAAELAVEVTDMAAWHQLMGWVFSNLGEQRNENGTIVNLHSYNAHRRWNYLAAHLVEVRREWSRALRVEGRRPPSLDGGEPPPALPQSQAWTQAQIEARFQELAAEHAAPRSADTVAPRVKKVPPDAMSGPRLTVGERLKARAKERREASNAR